MANFVKCGDNFKISIPSWEDIDKCTFYEICVNIDDIFWKVSRRYSEFAKLHECLTADHGVTIDILPPKKVLGNRDESFIEKRRRGLELYLSTVARFLQKAMPKQLAIFLHFHKYEITYIVKDMAVLFFASGEAILLKSKFYNFTTLQLYAINERLKQPCTTLDLLDKREDFSHVLDFCCQLTALCVTGSNVVIPNSNIKPNELSINLGIFKVLENLTMRNLNCNQILDLGSLRFTLKELTAENCIITSISNLILCDQIHKNNLQAHLAWLQLKKIIITKTNIIQIDESLQLLPNIQIIVLDENLIDKLNNLEKCHNLQSISMRSNCICLPQCYELNNPNLVTVDFSQNYISTLQPFSKLTNLETLNLQSNKVSDISEVQHLTNLPCLENLVLTGNPVSVIVDYRIKVLQYFGSKAYRVCLDNESANQKELDKVAILKALNASKEGQPYVEASPRLRGHESRIRSAEDVL